MHTFGVDEHIRNRYSEHGIFDWTWNEGPLADSRM